MNFTTPIETIENVLFFDKINNKLVQGVLILAQGSVYEVWLNSGEQYSFKTMNDLLKEFYFGRLPIEEKEFNFIQKLIITLFKLK